MKYQTTQLYCVHSQVARRTYKGIPEKLRGHIWALFLDVKRESDEHKGVYEVSTPA